MKLSVLIGVTSCLVLAGCGARQSYNKIIEDLGYIAYRTPLSSVGAGTIVKGKPSELIIYAHPETCMPNELEDGTKTQLRWVADTDLPSHLREVTFKFDANLSALGTNGNPLFKFKTNVNYINKVQVTFADAQVEYVNELYFWQYFKTNMLEGCRNAFTRYPFFRKSLKVGKMEYIFKTEAGASLELSAEKLKEIIDFEAGVEWSLKDEYTLTISTPKYIGFAAAQVDEAAILNEDITLFSSKVDSSGGYIWQNVAEKDQGFVSAEKLPLYNPRLLE